MDDTFQSNELFVGRVHRNELQNGSLSDAITYRSKLRSLNCNVTLTSEASKQLRQSLGDCNAAIRIFGHAISVGGVILQIDKALELAELIRLKNSPDVLLEDLDDITKRIELLTTPPPSIEEMQFKLQSLESEQRNLKL